MTRLLILDPCPRCGATKYLAACVLGRCEDRLGHGTAGRGATHRAAPKPPPLSRSEISRLGGLAAHEAGVALEWPSEAALEAGRKGGLTTSARRGNVHAVIRQLVPRETESLAVRALRVRAQERGPA